MNTACHYAVVRFLPFVETGEFANVGVILFAPQARYFGFKVLTQKHGRVTQFFDQFEPKDFREIMKTAREELQRVADRFKTFGTDRRLRTLDDTSAFALWNELTKPLESMLRMDQPRLAMTTEPKQKLEQLFQFYVERNFVTREYQEAILNRGVRNWLKEVHMAERFYERRVGNDEYDASFPFVAVEHDQPVQIIKPLHLNHTQAAKVIDHGGQWIVRINALKKRGLLPPQVLFPVNGAIDDTAPGKARREVLAELEELGVEIAPFADKQRVLAFAQRPH
jgi:hypothetical protein